MPEIYHDRGAALVATSMSAHARTGAWIASPKLQGWATGTTERPMTSASTCIGSHVAKARLDWLCGRHSQTVSVTNDTTGSAALVAHLHTLSPARIVLEVTGPYQMAVVAALVTAHVPWGHDRHRHVWDGAKATGHRATTDTNDAEVLAHVAAAIRLDPRPVPHPVPQDAPQHLTRLLTRRRHLYELLKAEQQRRARASSVVRDTIKRSIGYLTQC